jgi:hypothetical protein
VARECETADGGGCCGGGGGVRVSMNDGGGQKIG